MTRQARAGFSSHVKDNPAGGAGSKYGLYGWASARLSGKDVSSSQCSIARLAGSQCAYSVGAQRGKRVAGWRSRIKARKIPPHSAHFCVARRCNVGLPRTSPKSVPISTFTGVGGCVKGGVFKPRRFLPGRCACGGFTVAISAPWLW